MTDDFDFDTYRPDDDDTCPQCEGHAQGPTDNDWCRWCEGTGTYRPTMPWRSALSTPTHRRKGELA